MYEVNGPGSVKKKAQGSLVFPVREPFSNDSKNDGVPFEWVFCPFPSQFFGLQDDRGQLEIGPLVRFASLKDPFFQANVLSVGGEKEPEKSPDPRNGGKEDIPSLPVNDVATFLRLQMGEERDRSLHGSDPTTEAEDGQA